MSLRYRLFLWVSGLFIVISACSYVLENLVAQKELKKAKANLRQEILKLSEKRRGDIQDYLARVIAENQVRLDAILNNLSSFSPQALRFAPTLPNALKGTWGDVSDLLLENKWVDFIQNTNQGKTTASLIPKESGMGSVYRVDIDEDLCWIYQESESGTPVPYLGVRIPYSLSVENMAEALEQIPGTVPAAYLLFNPALMKEGPKRDSSPIFQDRKWGPIAVRWTEGYELDVEPFVKAFQRGCDLLASNQIQPPAYTSDQLKEKIASSSLEQKGGKLNAIPTQTLLSAVSNEDSMKKRFEQIALSYTQINVIWVMTAMFDSGVFGKDLFSFPSPTGATVFPQNKALGVSVLVSDVLSSDKIFDDSAYYLAHAPKDPQSHLGTSLAVIISLANSSVFLGNTAQFKAQNLAEDRIGYLTLGVGADSILQKLVLAIRQAAVLVYKGQPLSAYSEAGDKIEIDSHLQQAVSSIPDQKSGIVSWNGERNFFIRVQPFEEIDLHFFLLNPESKEFALLHDLETGSQKVVDTIRLDIHLAGLAALIVAIVLLHNIAGTITKPIAQLAKATWDVAEGRLDQVHLPPQKYNDEIALLCRSFEEMVKDFRKKKKSRGCSTKSFQDRSPTRFCKGGFILEGRKKE